MDNANMSELREVLKKFRSCNRGSPDFHESFNQTQALFERLAGDEGNSTREERVNVLIDWGNSLSLFGESSKDPAVLDSSLWKAAAKYEKADEISPRNARVLYNWGNILLLLAENELRAENQERARSLLSLSISKYEACSSVNPSHVDALHNLSMALRRASSLVASAEEKDALEKRASNVHRHLQLVRTGLGNFEDGVILLRAATEGKEVGNALFSDREYKKALAKYSQVLLDLRGMVGKLTFQDEEVAGQLKVACHLNMALCFLRLSNGRRAVESCDSVLEIAPRNVKALFRRGAAWCLLNDHERARVDYLAAQVADPKDPAIRRALVELCIKEKEQETQDRKVYEKMFGR